MYYNVSRCMCVCVCVCMCERDTHTHTHTHTPILTILPKLPLWNDETGECTGLLGEEGCWGAVGGIPTPTPTPTLTPTPTPTPTPTIPPPSWPTEEVFGFKLRCIPTAKVSDEADFERLRATEYLR